MKTYVFLYDEVPLCDVMLAYGLGGSACEVEIISETGKNIVTAEGMQIPSYMALSEVEMDSGDALVLCGGKTETVKDMDGLKHFIACAGRAGVRIGGMGAGADIVVAALQYDYDADRTAVFQNRVVLCPGNDYADLALEFLRTTGRRTDEADYLERIRYYNHLADGNLEKEIAKVS